MPEDAGSDTEEGENDNSEEEEEETQDNNDDEDDDIMVTPKKKSVKAATSTTASPKKKQVANKMSIESIAEGVGGLTVKCQMFSFSNEDIVFVRGPFTKTEGRYVTDFCEVDIEIGTPMPREFMSTVLSPKGTHIIYKKAAPEMFGEAARMKTMMGGKYRMDNSRVLAHDDTCQLIRETSKAKDGKFWCNDEDAQVIELPVPCRGMIHKSYPLHPTGQLIRNQTQYRMIMTCRVECANQRTRRERKGKVTVYDEGSVQTSEEESDMEEDTDDDDAAAAAAAATGGTGGAPDVTMSGRRQPF